MRSLKLFGLLAALTMAAACGGSSDITPPVVKSPALDPYITIKVIDDLDTTSTLGRTDWRVYALLTGPQANQNGIAPVGNLLLASRRIGVNSMCVGAGADSIGQRLITVFAIGDTVNKTVPSTSVTDTIVQRWYTGNHAPATGGLMVIATPETDAWTSDQFTAGHGLTASDPIRWQWTWSGTSTINPLAERMPSDSIGCAHE